MARIDDYNQALELGVKELFGKNMDHLAHFGGAEIRMDSAGNAELSMVFLNREVVISWPQFEMIYRDSGDDLPVQEKVLLAHYFLGTWKSSGAPLTGEWVAYQEISDGRFYLDAFLKRVKNPLILGFGQRPELLLELAGGVYGGEPFDQGDVSVVIKALPLVPLALILWKGDDEFPPEGNILFDRNISSILSAEDTAWLAGMAIYPLVGMAKSKN